MHHTYVRHDRTAGEQCQQVTLLGVASGARGGAAVKQHGIVKHVAGRAEGTGGAEGPAGMDGAVVAVAVPAVAPGVAALSTAMVATAVAAAAPASAGGLRPGGRSPLA